MTSAARASWVVLCLALSGCYMKVGGVESTAGGVHTTTTLSQVAGSARFSNGAAAFSASAFSSGQRVSPGATGGQVSLGKGATGVLVVGLVFVDLVSYIVGASAPKPLPPGEKIMDTCSCYQKQVIE
jgi:hypothetical protein